MTVQNFRDLLSKRPFEPFQVIMSSGEKYSVSHPELALLSRTTLYVGIKSQRQGIAADVAMCSLLHITAVEPLRNGRKSHSGH